MRLINDDPTTDVATWFQHKVADNYRLFFTVASRIVRRPDDAEDIVQEATLRAWNRLGELQEPAALVGWIARITRNLAMDWTRKRKPDLADDVTLDQVLPTPDAMARKVDTDDDRAAIVREFNNLPDAQAIVLTLRFFEELDIDEIAARLELTETNVRVRLHRGLETLRRRPHLRDMLMA